MIVMMTKQESRESRASEVWVGIFCITSRIVWVWIQEADTVV